MQKWTNSRLNFNRSVNANPPLNNRSGSQVKKYWPTPYFVLFFLQLMEILFETLKTLGMVCSQNFMSLCQYRSRYSTILVTLWRSPVGKGIHPPENSQNGGHSGVWMPLVNALARNMASAFWWRIIANHGVVAVSFFNWVDQFRGMNASGN